MNQQWPPVVVMGRPEARTRGPFTVPSRMASLREKVVVFHPPQSHTVVTPVCSAMATLWAERSTRMASVSSRLTSSPRRPVPGMFVCVWQSMRPGSSVPPGNSSTSPDAPSGKAICSSGPTARMRLSSSSTDTPVCTGESRPSMTRSALSIRNVGVVAGMASSSVCLRTSPRPPFTPEGNR